MYKGSVALSAGCGSGYRDRVRNLEVMMESLSGGSRPEIQEEGRVTELKKFLFKYSRRLWREANWVRLSAIILMELCIPSILKKNNMSSLKNNELQTFEV